MSIPFTQFLRPDGRRRPVEIDRPRHIETAAHDFIDLAEMTLRETARRLMRVRGRSFTVPAEFRRLMTDSLIPGVINVSRWWILSDFAIDGTGLRQIEGLYRLRNGEAKLVVEDALHTLEEMTQ